jgi:hypothetical protein
MKSDYIGLTVLFAIGIIFGSLLGIWVHPVNRLERVPTRTTINQTSSANDSIFDRAVDLPNGPSKLMSDAPIFLPPLVIRGRSRIQRPWNCRWHDQEQGIKACEWPTRKSM